MAEVQKLQADRQLNWFEVVTANRRPKPAATSPDVANACDSYGAYRSAADPEAAHYFIQYQERLAFCLLAA
jgi:hypothetical protein